MNGCVRHRLCVMRPVCWRALGTGRPVKSDPTTMGTGRPVKSDPTTMGTGRPVKSDPTTMGTGRPVKSDPTTMGTAPKPSSFIVGIPKHNLNVDRDQILRLLDLKDGPDEGIPKRTTVGDVDPSPTNDFEGHIVVGNVMKWLLQITHPFDCPGCSTVTRAEDVTQDRFPRLFEVMSNADQMLSRDNLGSFWLHIVKVYTIKFGFTDQIDLIKELSRLDNRFSLEMVQMNGVINGFLHNIRNHPHYENWVKTGDLEDLYRVSVFVHRFSSPSFRPNRLEDFSERFIQGVLNSAEDVEKMMRYIFLLHQSRTLPEPTVYRLEHHLLRNLHKLDMYQIAVYIACLSKLAYQPSSLPIFKPHCRTCSSRSYLKRHRALLPALEPHCVHILRCLNKLEDEHPDREFLEITLKVFFQHMSQTLVVNRITFEDITSDLVSAIGDCSIEKLNTFLWMRACQLVTNNASPLDENVIRLYNKLGHMLCHSYGHMRCKEIAHLFRLLVRSNVPSIDLRSFIENIAVTLMSKKRENEFKQFRYPYYQLAEMLADIGYYPEHLIAKLMQPEVQRDTLASIIRPDRQFSYYSVLTLDTRLTLDVPNYTGQRLVPEFVQFYKQEVSNRVPLPSTLTQQNLERVPYEWMRLTATHIHTKLGVPFNLIHLGWMFPHLTFLTDIILWFDESTRQAVPVERCNFMILPGLEECRVPDGIVGIVMICLRARDLHKGLMPRLMLQRLQLYLQLGYRICFVDGNIASTHDRFQVPNASFHNRRKYCNQFTLEHALSDNYSWDAIRAIAAYPMNAMADVHVADNMMTGKRLTSDHHDSRVPDNLTVNSANNASSVSSLLKALDKLS